LPPSSEPKNEARKKPERKQVASHWSKQPYRLLVASGAEKSISQNTNITPDGLLRTRIMNTLTSVVHEDGCSTFVLNACIRPQDCTATQPERIHSQLVTRQFPRTVRWKRHLGIQGSQSTHSPHGLCDNLKPVLDP
jgi:hypothetical protein